jgi:formate hydrogenlyase subunit 6/NADH:ubiquinone oxidoreductase subunit I
MKKPGKMTGQALSSMMQKPATVLYPFEKLATPPNMRGKIVADANKCIGCKLCVRDCPSDAIHIIKTGEKQFNVEFDLDRCLFCGQCVDSCNKDALALSPEFELAQLDPKKFKITYRNAGSPSPA